MSIQEASATRIVGLAVVSEEDQITTALADLGLAMAIDTVLTSLPALSQVSYTNMLVYTDFAAYGDCKHVNIWTTTKRSQTTEIPRHCHTTLTRQI
jgi:hypothetical protein